MKLKIRFWIPATMLAISSLFLVTNCTKEASIPVLTTNEVTEITQTTASSGGNVTSDGGATVTARGICWSTNKSPTIADSKTTDGTGAGSFASTLTSLTANTTYYVRAYATNSAGTGYGEEKIFIIDDVVIEITTSGITNITATSATSGGNITDDGGLSVTVRGVCWSTTQNPSNSDNKTTNGSGTGSFISNLSGLSSNTTYYVRAYATNSEGTMYGNELQFTFIECPSTVTDYDGNTYDVVKIGNQCWMAENLNVTHYANGTAIQHVTGETEWGNLTETNKAWCYYNNSSSNGDTYGALYTWAAAMNGEASSNNNPSGIQGVCPDGWHLPSDDEWEQLAEYISNDNGGYTKYGDDWNNVGEHLKATSGWNIGGNGTDDYGFSGLPGGYRDNDGTLDGIGYYGYWWSATEYSATLSLYRLMFYLDSNVFSISTNKEVGFSVRCLRD